MVNMTLIAVIGAGIALIVFMWYIIRDSNKKEPKVLSKEAQIHEGTG